MGSSKQFERYANVWHDYFVRFAENPKQDIFVECGDAKDAKATRMEFYKAREAFIKSTPHDFDFVDALNQREAQIKGTGVLFTYKDQNRIAKFLQAALDKIDATKT